MKNKFAGLLHGHEKESTVSSPEVDASRGVRLFCESGSPNNAGEEVLHLPVIVEAAESSPRAAAAAAAQIRHFLKIDNCSRPHVQYNALMLIRILADNPGQSFTRNIDSKFVITVKELRKHSKDPSVQQLLAETLDALGRDKSHDVGLAPLLAMWGKEKGANTQKRGLLSGQRTNVSHQPQYQQQHQVRPSPQSQPSLPPPAELAQRIEEGRTSAKLLLQLIQSTPSSEVLSSELITEFADRCLAAQRSMQGYINSRKPPPDDDTMLTLIETNEQLSLACSKHHRAVLQARRINGSTNPSPYPTAGDGGRATDDYLRPPGAPPQRQVEADQAPLAGNSTGYRRQTATTVNEAFVAPSRPPTFGAVGTAPDVQRRQATRQSQNGPDLPPVPPAMQARLHQRQLSQESKKSDRSSTAEEHGYDGLSDDRRPPEPVSAPTQHPADPVREPAELDAALPHSAYTPIPSSLPIRPRPPIPAAPSLDTSYSPPAHVRGADLSPLQANEHRDSTISDVSPIDPRHNELYNASPVLPAELSAEPKTQPYHPRFSATPSYVHRQDSSINHVTMSGAGVAELPSPSEYSQDQSPQRMRRGEWVDE